METQKQLISTDCKEEICGLYLNLKDFSPDDFILMKFAVNVECECSQEQENAWKNTLVLKG